MQTGQLTVTGNNFTSILLSGRPREVFVRFKGNGPDEHHEHHHHHPHPCNPVHKDKLEWEIKGVDETALQHSRFLHHHHDRQYYLIIRWEVESVREIDWIVIY
jgi:hypothetical protein